MKRLETTINTSQAYIRPVLIDGLSLKIRRYKSNSPQYWWRVCLRSCTPSGFTGSSSSPSSTRALASPSFPSSSGCRRKRRSSSNQVLWIQTIFDNLKHCNDADSDVDSLPPIAPEWPTSGRWGLFSSLPPFILSMHFFIGRIWDGGLKGLACVPDFLKDTFCRAICYRAWYSDVWG